MSIRRRWRVILVAACCLAVVAYFVVQRRRDSQLMRIGVLLYRNDLAALEQLVKEGFDVNMKSSDGVSPIHLPQSKEAVAVLVNAGADVSRKTPNGLTALHFAAMNGNAGVIAALIRKGADVNAVTTKGDTPLHILCNPLTRANGDVYPELSIIYRLNSLLVVSPRHSLESLRQLVNAGATIDAFNDEGATPAYLAAMAPSEPELLEELLRRGASINVAGPGGRPFLGDQYAPADERVREIVATFAATRPAGGK